ncbi:capsule biosynthesis protein [Aquicoccus porphyridii]|uniref:Capsule biosynthesis protein n=1 Tax=Aquicoccus porphyridii TaxID=1852029 RepID=A0A5A9YYA9_9RHOB|nr:capsule biosynthesis protein [Aquicoccus porphyridii]KAA0909860.1 capsule biosynthesis protein [Aquicoccus porphyridii]RAI53228.1 capsule biosynthesis protein [Rhodobacteraceae bacterium AsT-22]
MTTKPKARKFRIHRTAPGAAAGAEQRAQARVAEDHARHGKASPAAAKALRDPVTPEKLLRDPQAAPAADDNASAASPANSPANSQSGPARSGEVASARETRTETDIDAIRKEGLTGRQLRMARRVAQKHGLAPISDFDAVRQLRLRGIDPFQRSTMLELVVPKDAGGRAAIADTGNLPAGATSNLPQTVQPGKTNLPSTDTTSPADRRASEIMAIQRDIMRRRRKRLILLFTRLAAFVFLPTLLAGWYYFAVATPMYSTKTEFLILQADGAGGSGMGGFLPTQYATSQDSIAVQSYLQSKDAMQRLDDEMGYKAHFSQDWIDPIQRLSPDATNEDAYKLYKENIKIGYDPTEGVVRMEVIAADPQIATDFSSHLITYAEERVDELSRQKREDAMRSASESLEKAKTERREAQEALVRLQETQGVDPTEQLAVLRQQIGQYEMQLQEKQLQLQALLDNARPNQAKVDGASGDIRRLENLLTRLTAEMSEAQSGTDSLAARAARIEMAKADLATADLFLQSALQNEKQTALEANRQVRYLTVPVRPIAADAPAYPRAFENTLLAFLIFAGIYLMVSLTSSILREQVSS